VDLRRRAGIDRGAGLNRQLKIKIDELRRTSLAYRDCQDPAECYERPDKLSSKSMDRNFYQPVIVERVQEKEGQDQK
jgi:hypothetical protein